MSALKEEVHAPKPVAKKGEVWVSPSGAAGVVEYVNRFGTVQWKSKGRIKTVYAGEFLEEYTKLEDIEI